MNFSKCVSFFMYLNNFNSENKYKNAQISIEYEYIKLKA